MFVFCKCVAAELVLMIFFLLKTTTHPSLAVFRFKIQNRNSCEKVLCPPRGGQNIVVLECNKCVVNIRLRCDELCHRRSRTDNRKNNKKHTNNTL